MSEAVMIRNDDTFVERFKMMLDEARDWAERSGLTESDIDEAVKAVRRRKRA